MKILSFIASRMCEHAWKDKSLIKIENYLRFRLKSVVLMNRISH